MPAKQVVDKEARLRRKLVNNEMNPIVDAVLTIVLLIMTPFIWMFAMIHDKLMFKFLNKTYIYNVRWEVINIIVLFSFLNSNLIIGSSHGSKSLSSR